MSLPQPRLVIEYLTQNTSTFGALVSDGFVWDAVKVGWSWYSRYPAKAFFTLRQGSLNNARLVPLKTHIRIWYVNEVTGYGPVLVFAGRLGEPDSTGSDVVWEAWGYLADLSLSRSGYRVLYPTKMIGTEIAAVEWGLAKAATYSLLSHVATGTFENPLGSDGSTPIKTDTRFGVIDTPRLLLLFDLSEIGRANTVNNCTFEITRSTTPTFNFWKNRGSAYTAKRLCYPNGSVTDYRFSPGFRSLRNDLATIGTTAGGGAAEVVATDAASMAEYGRRQDVFTIKTLAGIAGAATEADAQKAITERAVKEATSLQKSLQLDVRTSVFEPFDGWDLEDTITVQLKRGRDNLNGTYRIVGVRGIQNPAGYDQQLVLTLPTAA